jgi:glucuronokinase
LSATGEARGRAFARAALLGNPSDGFGGATIGLVVRDFAAEVAVREAATSRIAIDDPGARRLVEAATGRFEQVAREHGATPQAVEATLATDIPRQVGLGGSSAIVIATLRALSALHRLELAAPRLAELALAVESEDLGIPAGPQDRVVQAYEGLVYMDFGPGVTEPYELLDPALLPPLFVAHRADASQSSAAVHTDLRHRFERRDPETLAVIEEIAGLARSGRDCLLDGDREGLGRLMERNVAARARLVELDPRHMRMVELARSLGAPANYAGSGGAIVGLVPERSDPDALRAVFAPEGCELLFPEVARSPNGA